LLSQQLEVAKLSESQAFYLFCHEAKLTILRTT
jgi:hypothetical protein